MIRSSSSPHRPRSGFTLVELLVVMGLIALLTSTIVVVYARSGENARVAGTKTLIKQLDSALRERLDAFSRYGTNSQAETFRALVAAKYSTVLTEEEAKVLYRKLLFRGSFPQRIEDLFGLDGTTGGTGPDADALLLTVIAAIPTKGSLTHAQAFGTHANDPTGETVSAELLYLILTRSEAFGVPPLDVDLVSPLYIRDTDGDGFLEFVDGWEKPLRFYNSPTGLLRPSGNSGGASISLTTYQTASVLITSLPPVPAAGLAYDDYTNPLNIDPQDPLGEMQSARVTGGSGLFGGIANFENRFHAFNTFHTPLIVSGGPDERLGLNEPIGSGVQRLGVVNSLDAVYDNLTNQQRGGF